MKGATEWGCQFEVRRELQRQLQAWLGRRSTTLPRACWGAVRPFIIPRCSPFVIPRVPISSSRAYQSRHPARRRGIQASGMPRGGGVLDLRDGRTGRQQLSVRTACEAAGSFGLDGDGAARGVSVRAYREIVEATDC